MTDRVSYVDVAKGISIILVALFHSKLNLLIPEVGSSMSLFRLPLFFFMSGVFFNVSNDPKTFFWKKFDALLKPYFITFIIILFISIILNEENLIYKLKCILYGSGKSILWAYRDWAPLWFLTHLFAVHCFIYLIFRYTGFKSTPLIFKFTILIAMLLVGTHWVDIFSNTKIIIAGESIQLPDLPFSLDVILVSAPFFIMGALTKVKIVLFKPNLYWLFISVLLYILIVMFTDARIMLGHRDYNLPFIATLGAACGIYALTTISYYLDKIPVIRGVLLSFGSSSLFVLIFHMYIGNHVYNILSDSGSSELRFNFAIIAFLLSITIPLAIKFLISKSDLLSLFYFPVQSNRLLNRIRKVKL